MRLNALSPSDNPMEELLFCFGGPSDSGDTGGPSTQDKQMDELDQISADFENMSQQQAAGESVTSGMSGGVGRGGSANDNDGDGIPNSIDATPGVDRSGIGAGGGDAFDQSRSYLDQSIADFSRGPAGVAGANIGDTSLIDSYLEGPMLADISTPMTGGAFVGGQQAGGIAGRGAGFPAGLMADIPAIDYGKAGQISQVPGSMARDTSIEYDVFGSGEDDYTTQDIFERDPTGLGFETRQERNQRERQDNTRAAAQAAAAMEATAEAQRQAQMAALGVSPQDRALQAELDAINQARQTQQAEEDALSAQLDAEKAAREARTTAPESRGIDSLMGGTVFGVPDDLGPSEDIGIGQSAAVRGINTNISGVTEVDATQQAADAARAATGIQSVSGRGLPSDSADGTTQAERAAAADAAARERTVNGVPVTDFSQPRTDTTPSFNPTVEVVNVSGPGRKEIDIADYQPTDYDNEDLARAEREFDRINLEVAERDFDAARREAYADKQFGFDTGLPGSIDIFGAKVPTGVGVVEGIVDALFDPTSSAANAIAERGIKSVDGMSAEGTANYNPNGLEVVTAGGPLSEGGRTAAYDPSNNIVYDTSPFSGLNPFGEGVPDNIQDLYSRKNAIDDAERARQGGDGGGPIIPPLIEEEPVVPEEVPPGFELGEYQYEPMDPVQISYTGIPTLAPRILRPSRMASRNIQPLYDFSGLGSLRRS